MINKKKLSTFFFNDGVILNPEVNKKFMDLNVNQIVKIFELKGVILFKDFEIDPKN